MSIELEIPKIFVQTTKIDNPEEAYQSILEYEQRKNPKEQNLTFNAAYLRRGNNNREIYFLEAEEGNGWGVILIADVKHAQQSKENVIYYVIAYQCLEERKRIIEPFTMKFFKTLSSACIYAKGLIKPNGYSAFSGCLISELSLEDHLKAINNSFTNNNIKVSFNSEVNYHISQLKEANETITDKELLITAVNQVIKKEYFYLTPYVQSVNRFKPNELTDTLNSLVLE